MDRLVLVDGHAVVYRAFYAFPATLTTKSGEMINAVYGFASILLTAIKELHPEYMAVAFDLDKPTFRHLEYVGYKAQRPEADKAMIGQLDRVKEVVETLNIPIFQVEGFEADDVIGTLSCQSRNKDVEAIILTGDQDAMQLVNGHVKVYLPARGQVPARIYGGDDVRERYGLEPKQIADYKALSGDPSDNIPGVHGIGPKAAVDLLKQFGTVEKIYEHIKEIPEKRQKLLLDGYEQAQQGKHLATIVCDVPITLDLDACRVTDYDQKRVLGLFEQLGFKSLIKKLPNEVHPSPQIGLF
jgi:DNA polymerase-1